MSATFEFVPEARRALRPGELEIMKGRGDRQRWFYVATIDDAKMLVRLGRNHAFPTGITGGDVSDIDDAWTIEAER